MAIFESWKLSSFTLESDVALVPKVFLNTVVPSSPELTAIASKELADGWPGPVVAQAGARRATKHRYWFGPNGVSRGLLPDHDLINNQGSLGWVSRVGKLHNVIHPDLFKSPEYRVRQLLGESNITGYVDPYTPAFPESWSYRTDMIWSTRVCSRLLGRDDLVPLSISTYAIPAGAFANGFNAALNTGYGSFLDAIPTEDDGTLTVVYSWMPTIPETNSNSFVVVRVKFARPADMPGVHGVAFAPVYVQSWLNSASPANGYDLRLVGIVSQPGWRSLISLANPHMRFTTTTPSVTVAADGKNLSDLLVRFADVSGPTDAFASTLPFTSLLGVGPHQAGLSCVELYHIGDPEFVDSYAIIGPVTRRGTGFHVAATEVYFRWKGEDLVAMDTGTMSAADRDSMAGQRFHSLLAPNPIIGPIEISQLSFYNDMVNAGEDPAAQVIVEAADGKPAITLGEGVARANSADRRIYHAMLGKAGDKWNNASLIRVSGTSLAFTISIFDGTWTTCDAETATQAFLRGAEFCNTSNMDPGVAFSTALGMSIPDAMSKRGKADTEDEFDEQGTFSGRRPDVRRLSASRQAAMMIVQFTHNRSQMSSFLIGSCVMATNARKRLM